MAKEVVTGSNAMLYPPREQWQALRSSADARAAWRAQRLASRHLPDDITKRGRQQRLVPEAIAARSFLLSPISSLQIAAIDRYVAYSPKPLLDVFTNHHVIEPTVESLERYVRGAIFRVTTSSRQNSAKRKLTAANYVSNVLTADEVEKKRRQPLHIIDLTEQAVFDDRNIAYKRASGLETTTVLLKAGQKLDKQALVDTTDAIEDFGFCLAQHAREVAAGIVDKKLGYQIAYLGQTAVDRPEILSDSIDLLKTVHTEQEKRGRFWNAIYEVSRSCFDDQDHLTTAIKNDWLDVQTELGRQAELRKLYNADL